MIRNFDGYDIVTSGENFARGREATRQGVLRRLRLFVGEYFLDSTAGTPWFDEILGKSERDIAELALRGRIATSPGVVAISEFRMNFEPRYRRLRVEARLIDANNEQFAISFDEDLMHG